MNRNEAAYLAPIVKAFGDGKDVQFEDQFENVFAWVTDPDPKFNPRFKWRVKPEPRVFWVHENMNQVIYDISDLIGWTPSPRDKYIKVIEVLEDE